MNNTMYTTGCVTGTLGLAEPCHERLMAISALENPADRDRAADALLEEIAASHKARLRDLADTNGVTPVLLHHDLGIDMAYAYRMLRGQCPISTPNMAAICYDHLHVSCHELVFGERARVILPMPLSAVISRLVETGALTDKAGLQLLLSRYAPEPVPRTTARELLDRRLAEIAEDQSVSLFTAANDNPWYLPLIRQFRVRKDFFGGVVPGVKRLMRFAMLWRRPIDWFLARDYTPYAELYYRDGDRILPVSNAFRTLVSVYLRLPDDDQVRMLAELLTEAAA